MGGQFDQSLHQATSSPTDSSKAVPLLHLLVCAWEVSYMAFVLSLFVPHRTFSWCLRKAVFRDCGVASGRLCFVIVALPQKGYAS